MALFRIEREEHSEQASIVIVLITLVLTFAGYILERKGVAGALLASSGLVVAVTTPIFASTIAQITDYAFSVRMQLYHFRLDRASVQEIGLDGLSPRHRAEMESKISDLQAKTVEFEEHQNSLRRSTRWLVWTQSAVVAVSALLASFGGYLSSYFKCGAIQC